MDHGNFYNPHDAVTDQSTLHYNLTWRAIKNTFFEIRLLELAYMSH